MALLSLDPSVACSAPLLQSQAHGRDAAPEVAQTTDTGSAGWSGLNSGAKEEIARHLSGKSAAEETSPGMAGNQRSPLLDPGEEALQAIAQSLKDSPSFRQILSATVGLHDDRADPDARDAAESGVLVADALGATDARSGLAEPLSNAVSARNDTGRQTDGTARQPAQRKAPQRGGPGEIFDTTLTQDDGPTLRTVLRSFVRVRRGEARQRPQTVAQSVTDMAGDVVDDGLSLGERMLDSRMLGDAVRAVITQPGFYQGDPSFAILGHGKFDMELDLSMDLAGVTVSESASGASASMTFDPKPAYGMEPQARQAPPEKVDLLQLISNFVQSATGISLLIISTVLFALLGMFKVVVWINR